MATRTITGLIRRPDETPWAGAVVTFRPNTFAFASDAIYPSETVAVTADDGTFSVDLAGDLPTTWNIEYPDGSATQRAVITSGPPMTLSELLATNGIPTPMTNDVQIALDAGFAAFSDELPADIAEIMADPSSDSRAAVQDIVRGDLPDPARTINVVGDVHYGTIIQTRLDVAAADLIESRPYCAHRVYIGDMVQSGADSSQNTGALAWATSIDADRDDWDTIPGNHEYDASANGASWATFWGYDSYNYIRDLGFCTMIVVSAEDVGSPYAQTLSSETLAWLDAQLAATSQDCIIFSHGPLRATVTGTKDQGSGATSFDPNLYTHPDDEVRAILARYRHARAWISGHIHSRMNAPDLVKAEPVGDRTIVAINASAIYQTLPTSDPATDAIASLFVSVFPDRIEVRCRNHRTGAFDDLMGPTVITIPNDDPVEARTVAKNPMRLLVTFDDAVVGTTPDGTLTMTTTGTLTYTDGHWDGVSAAIFDGSTERVNFEQAGIISPNEGSIVIAATVGDTASDPYIFTSRHSSLGENRLYIKRKNSDNTIYAVLGNAEQLTSRVSVDDGAPFIVGLSWNRGVMRLWLDGAYQGAAIYTGLTSVGNQAAIGNYSLGGFPINGTVTAAAFFGRELTNREHADLASRTRIWTIDARQDDLVSLRAALDDALARIAALEP